MNVLLNILIKNIEISHSFDKYSWYFYIKKEVTMPLVFITGASSGIGKALAYEFSSRGSHVFCCARNQSSLEQICRDINTNGGHADFAYCDVTDQSSIDQAVAICISKYGMPDTVVLNAGISGSESILNFSHNEFSNIYNVNLFGVTRCFQTFIPIMKDKGGKIAVVSSMSDIRGFAGSAAYSSSKSALSKFLESAKNELSQSGIDVITIRPGFVHSEMTAKNNFKMPFIMHSDKAARIIVSKIEKNYKTINFPFITYFLTQIIKLMPDFLFDYLMKMRNKGK